MDTLKAICASVVLLILIGCGGGSGTPPAPTPTPTPASALTVCGKEGSACVNPTTIAFGATEQFVATSTSGTTPTLTWSVNGVQGGSTVTGTISQSGLFTAPAAFDSGKEVTITATSQADSATTASASAIIVDNALPQSPPVKLGTTGGNSTDLVNNGKTITCCSGTLGGLVSRGGNFFILSNNHVLDKSDTGNVGDPIGQPGLVDNGCKPGNMVASLTQAAALKPITISTTGACAGQPAPCGPAPSNVDAAIAQIAAGQVDPTGNILDLGPTSGASITAMPPSSTLADPANVLATGEGVAKSGRRTGLTCSNLQSVSTTVSVVYDASCGGATAFTATFSNQVIINGGSFSSPGDSGSLVVTSDTAHPLGLLYGGNSTTSAANPIQDVLNAFSSGGTLSVVGGGDHAVSCAAVANPAVATAAASFTALSAQERQRASAVRQKNAAGLMRDLAIASVTLGASDDSPGEAALVIQVTGATQAPIPAVVEGVRTKVVSARAGAAQMPLLMAQDMDQAIAVKENHAAALMAQPGIQGVGVGRSSDNPAETAIIIYVISGISHAAIPATLDGVRTRIVEGDRFRAF